MNRLLLPLIIISLATLSCSSTQLLVEPHGNLQEINEDLRLTVRGDTVAPDVLDELERYLRANLGLAGFKLDASPPEDAATHLDVDVHEFDAGSRGLRVTIGFGAGRGSLLYTARYLDPDGKVLASMEGQERFTGGDVDLNIEYGTTTGFGGAEVVQEVLSREAAKHIVALGEGRL